VEARLNTLQGNLSDEDLIQIVIKFNEALNARDIDGMMALLSEDSVFENTFPAPDGERYSGKARVREFWLDFFHSSSSARIEAEELFAMRDRCVMRWTYHWSDPEGNAGHIRGVDIYRILDGLIAEKFSYVKG
jgi:ketosteroid isomerase-like protein